MGKAEARIERSVCNYAEKEGFLARKYASLGVKGAPDRIFYGHGQCFLMEFKSEGGTLSRPQEREIHRIRSHGVKVFVVNSIYDGQVIIDGAIAAGASGGWSV